MEAFRMNNQRKNIFIRPYPQRLDSMWQPTNSFHAIESAYPHLL